MLQAIATFPIILGAASFLLGVYWIVMADAEERDHPDNPLMYLLEVVYFAIHAVWTSVQSPLDFLAGLGFILLGIALIAVGVWMW